MIAEQEEGAVRFLVEIEQIHRDLGLLFGVDVFFSF